MACVSELIDLSAYLLITIRRDDGEVLPFGLRLSRKAYARIGIAGLECLGIEEVGCFKVAVTL